MIQNPSVTATMPAAQSPGGQMGGNSLNTPTPIHGVGGLLPGQYDAANGLPAGQPMQFEHASDPSGMPAGMTSLGRGVVSRPPSFSDMMRNNVTANMGPAPGATPAPGSGQTPAPGQTQAPASAPVLGPGAPASGPAPDPAAPAAGPAALPVPRRVNANAYDPRMNNLAAQNAANWTWTGGHTGGGDSAGA